MTKRVPIGLLVGLGALLAAPGAWAGDKVPKADTAGEPKMTPGAEPTIWVWHDDTGWHLRFTGGSAKETVVFTGIVNVAGGRVTSVQPKMTGGNDSMNRIDGARAFFKSEVKGEIEGMDFQAKEDLGALYLELYVNYDTIAPKIVKLGKDQKPATSVSPALHISLE